MSRRSSASTFARNGNMIEDDEVVSGVATARVEFARAETVVL